MPALGVVSTPNSRGRAATGTTVVFMQVTAAHITTLQALPGSALGDHAQAVGWLCMHGGTYNLWHILMPLPNEVGIWAVWMVCDGIGVTHDQV